MPATAAGTAPPHDHVVVDEAVFHAYMDTALAARRVCDGQDDAARLCHYLNELDAALAASERWDAAAPGHHGLYRPGWVARQWARFRAWQEASA